MEGKTIIYLLTFIDLFAVGLVVPLVSAHVLSLGGSHFFVGLMGSFYSGWQLFSSPVMGNLSDIHGRKPILTILLFFCTLAYFAFGCITSLYVLLFLRVILGIFKHTQTLSKAFVSDLIERKHHLEVQGKMAAISGAGITFGPLVGGYISEHSEKYGFFICCSICASLFALNTFLVQIAKTKEKQTLSNGHKAQNINYVSMITKSATRSIKELKDIDWHLYWDVFLLKGFLGFSMSIFYSNYSVLLKTVYGLSPKWIGYTISFQGLVGAFSSYFMKYINEYFYKRDDDFKKRNLHSFIMLVCTFASFLICDRWTIFVFLLIPLAVANAVLRLVTLEMILKKTAPERRGSLIGAATSVRSVSGIMGPFVAGTVADLIGVKYVTFVSFVSAGVGLYLAVLYDNSKTTNSERIKKIS